MCQLSRGDRFQDARLVHNKNGSQTMDEVANAVGIKKSMLADLENDDKQRDVKHSYIIKLSKHYGVSTDYLLGMTNDPFPKPTAIDELGLSPAAVSQIKNLSNYTGNGDFSFSDMLEIEEFQDLLISILDYGASVRAEVLLLKFLATNLSNSEINAEALLDMATKQLLQFVSTNSPDTRLNFFANALAESNHIYSNYPAFSSVIAGSTGANISPILEFQTGQLMNHTLDIIHARFVPAKIEL